MNIRLIGNLTMATLLLIGSACGGMFARDEKAAAGEASGGAQSSESSSATRSGP
jgi:hypothetical protein